MTSAVATSPYTSEELQRILKTVNALESTTQDTLAFTSWLLIFVQKIWITTALVQLASFVCEISLLLTLIDSLYWISARFMYIFCPVSTFFPMV